MRVVILLVSQAVFIAGAHGFYVRGKVGGGQQRLALVEVDGGELQGEGQFAVQAILRAEFFSTRLKLRQQACSFALNVSSIRLVIRCSISWRMSIRNSRLRLVPSSSGDFGCFRQWRSSQYLSAPCGVF